MRPTTNRRLQTGENPSNGDFTSNKSLNRVEFTIVTLEDDDFYLEMLEDLITSKVQSTLRKELYGVKISLRVIHFKRIPELRKFMQLGNRIDLMIIDLNLDMQQHVEGLRRELVASPYKAQGMQFAKDTLLRDFPDIPFVFFTSQATTGRINEALLRLHAEDIILKDSDQDVTEELVSVIVRILVANVSESLQNKRVLQK